MARAVHGLGWCFDVGPLLVMMQGNLGRVFLGAFLFQRHGGSDRLSLEICDFQRKWLAPRRGSISSFSKSEGGLVRWAVSGDGVSFNNYIIVALWI